MDRRPRGEVEGVRGCSQVWMGEAEEIGIRGYVRPCGLWPSSSTSDWSTSSACSAISFLIIVNTTPTHFRFCTYTSLLYMFPILPPSLTSGSLNYAQYLPDAHPALLKTGIPRIQTFHLCQLVLRAVCKRNNNWDSF